MSETLEEIAVKVLMDDNRCAWDVDDLYTCTNPRPLEYNNVFCAYQSLNHDEMGLYRCGKELYQLSIKDENIGDC